MNSIEETFSPNKSLSLITLLRMIFESIEYHPKRGDYLLKTMRDFNVNEKACDSFVNNLASPKLLVSYFNSFDTHQKDYTILIVWELLKSAGGIKEEEFKIAIHTLETVAGISPNRTEEVIDKMESLTKQVVNTTDNVSVTHDKVGNNNSQSDFKSVLGIIILALAIFGLVSMCK